MKFSKLIKHPDIFKKQLVKICAMLEWKDDFKKCIEINAHGSRHGERQWIMNKLSDWYKHNKNIKFLPFKEAK